MKTDVVSIGEESYQIIASNMHSGRVINRTIRRSDAIELLAYYHQYRAMQQKDPSAMHRGLMEGTGNRL
ncbi:hypothetical protein, partial [Ventosimonas gracilis]|uniref:hypothetical protein n=1 Tax=Ventosimonas gracilis TaxID=1680762 RepID=UPI00128F9E7D